MTWNPWEIQYGELFETWLRASLLSGIVNDDHSFDYDDLIPMIDNAENLDLLGDMSREKAILLIGLWMGRYQGNQETGRWKPKIFAGETEIERTREACQEFIDSIDNGQDDFWECFARLLVALQHLHPENVT